MTIRDLRSVAENMPFNKLIGIRVMRRHCDGVTLECKMRDDHKNVAGVMHGGVAATLADAAVGIALASHFEGRRPCTTTDLKINYLRPIAEGKIVARSHLLRVGKQLCVARVDMFDSHRKLAAVAIVTYMLL
ncbi:MAG TPA: PaaI family thioesterase [Bryobacteraceae bacterium]|nr:PaaI family thioesterase [Bryobacteraceae bacterium]